jgi:hypothetical protein
MAEHRPGKVEQEGETGRPNEGTVGPDQETGTPPKSGGGGHMGLDSED